MRNMKNIIALLVSGAAFFTSGLYAQEAKKIDFPQASPTASIKERVGVTAVSVDYSRPSARDRKIFGGLVPYGSVWRTGANAATKITFSTDVKLGGAAVPAGSYALFTIPGETEWTVILSKVVDDQWGSYAYNQKDDQARVKVKSVAMAEPLETMTIGLQDLHAGKANLVIAWEKTKVPIEIDTDVVAKVRPQIEAAMAGSGEKPYFAAAMFYYENDLDMALAKEWIEAAAKKQPDAVWIVYRKGLILKKAGDKEGAMAAAKQALELASKAEGEIKAEYTRLSETLIASLK
jgi:tetratricopeptide (TPR) repeat protein